MRKTKALSPFVLLKQLLVVEIGKGGWCIGPGVLKAAAVCVTSAQGVCTCSRAATAHVRGEGVWGAWGGYSTGPRCKAGCQRDAEESEQLFCCDSHGRNDQKAGAGLLLFQAAAGNSVAVWDKVANFLCSSNFMFASWR